MKNLLSVLSMLTIGFFLLTSLSLREQPQDPPRGKKKRIKIVKVQDGKKTVIDTMVADENVFYFKNDSLKDLKWISKSFGDFKNLDSLKDITFDFDIDVDEDKKGHKVIMMKSGNMVKEFKFGDNEGKGVFIFSDDGCKKVHGNAAIWMHSDDGHGVDVAVPHVKVVKKKSGGNVIDLSDPGIISYKKKKLSDGREKIEIIRKEVKDEVMHDVDVHIEQIDGLHKIHELHGAHPIIEKRVKVIKEGDGVFHIHEDENVKIEKAIKEDGEVEVKVEVEIEEEELEEEEEKEEENEGHEK